MDHLEDYLRLVADLNSFTGERAAAFAPENELSLEDLELVNAAAARPDHRDFQELLRKRRK